MFELVDSAPDDAVIKVVGVGGGGGNAVKNMIDNDVGGVEFICANTDAQALKGINARTVLQLGNNMTKGLGAGANPEIGRQAAMEDRERIAEALNGADMVFITAGMGGGTGTGAAPVVAEIARDMGILTVAVVTTPFSFEGKKRASLADNGLTELEECVDSLITVPNQKLLSVLGKGATIIDAFKAGNTVLLEAVQGIADLIMRPGLINLDFADVRTVMSEMGIAMMGTGIASGEGRAITAAEAALNNPLLEDVNLNGARGVLVNVTGGIDMTMDEFEEVGEMVREFASDDATVVVGNAIDMEMGEEIRVTVVATGLASNVAAAPKPVATKVVDNTRRTNSGPVDYDKPTVMRKAQTQSQAQNTSQSQPQSRGQSGNSAAALAPAIEEERDMEYLDIPAFLRRQAD
jgi:cell division protein FtsZ